MKNINVSFKHHKVWAMRMKFILAVLLLAISFSCKKLHTDYPPLPTPNFVDLKLKDIVIQNLPSPYYHFEYDNDGRISKFDFATGWFYGMTYSGNNITLMKDYNASITGDSIKYVYSNDTLTNILVISDGGINYRRAFLSYNAEGQLQMLDWEIKLGNN